MPSNFRGGSSSEIFICQKKKKKGDDGGYLCQPGENEIMNKNGRKVDIPRDFLNNETSLSLIFLFLFFSFLQNRFYITRTGGWEEIQGFRGHAQRGRNEGSNYRRQSTVCSVINSIINSVHDE